MLTLERQPRHSMHRPRANSTLCLSLAGFRVRHYGGNEAAANGQSVSYLRGGCKQC
jgi:hypothetical protein